MRQKKARNILIINPFGIGDVLFSTPLVKTLRQCYPDGKIGYVCNIRTESILNSNPNIDEVYVYEKDDFRELWSKSKLKCIAKFFKLLAAIRRGHYNVLINLSLGRQYSFFCMLLGIGQRIGFNYKNRDRFLTHKIDIEGYDSRHIADYYLSLLQFLDIKPVERPKLEFFVQVSDNLWASAFLSQRKITGKNTIVGIMPGGGTSWGEKAGYKHWPEEKFSELIKKLHKEYSADVIIFGDSKEADKCDRITSGATDGIINVCGQLSLGRFAALLRFCDVAVANDGGPLHVAISQGVPVVSIFGPVDEKVYGPYPACENNIVIKENIDCRPCYKKFRMPECKNRICLNNIEVDDVLNAARQILQRRKSMDRGPLFNPSKVPLTVVVLTKNEADNIANCLESVSWADEIIIVDDFSADDTVRIASGYTDKIFKRKMVVEGTHRNWAYGQARNKWVLSLDADETASDELKNEIERLIKQPVKLAAFSIPLRNYIGSYWVKHGGWYPAGKVRLFDKGRFKYEEAGVHPRVFIDGKCGHLKGDIIHKGYPDFGHFLESLNRQTSLEAMKWIDDKRKMSFAITLRKSTDRFLKTYILKKGYKDGFIGFMVAFFTSLYQIMSYAKYWELKRKNENNIPR